MKYIITVLLAFSCSHRSLALTADQLAQFLQIKSWESEVALPASSFSVELFEFADGKVGKPISPLYEGPDAASQNPSATGGTPLLIMWKPGDHALLFTVTMGLQTRPGIPGACQNFNGPFVFKGSPKSVKEGDYLLGGEPLRQDGVYMATGDIKDYKRGFLLRVRQKS